VKSVVSSAKPSGKKLPLRKVFKRCAKNATKPGKSTTWYDPYLAAVLEEFYEGEARRKQSGKPARKTIPTIRPAIHNLLKNSCDRDRKMLSRWAAALTHAVLKKVSPTRLAKWLKKKGGVSGAAAKLSTNPKKKAPKNTPKKRPKPVAIPKLPWGKPAGRQMKPAASSMP
jgi:hypothetical protein